MDLTTIIVAIIAAGLGGVITAVANRRKISADASFAIAEASREILKDYRLRVDELEQEQAALKVELRQTQADCKGEIRELRERLRQAETEIAVQERDIETVNDQYRKLELAFIVNELNARGRGFELLIQRNRLEAITLDELRETADAVRHLEEGRLERRARKEDKDNADN